MSDPTPAYRSMQTRLLLIAEDMQARHAPGTNHCLYGGSVERGWAKHHATEPCPDVLAARRLKRLANDLGKAATSAPQGEPS